MMYECFQILRSICQVIGIFHKKRLSDILDKCSQWVYTGMLLMSLIWLQSLEFSEIVFNSDWIELHSTTLKGLLIMMLRTASPILLTCGPFITLSLSSFTSVSLFSNNKSCYITMSFLNFNM